MKTNPVTKEEKAAALQYKGVIGKEGQSAMVWNLDESVTGLQNQGENQPNHPQVTVTSTLTTSTHTEGVWDSCEMSTKSTKSTESCGRQLNRQLHRQNTILVMNEAKLEDTECARLWHWRTGHAGPEVTMKMGVAQVRLNENCYCCD